MRKCAPSPRRTAATPYDIPDVAYAHVGPECSFDAFIRIHRLGHPALAALAAIVRAADTSALHLAPQAPGLLAASLGLSAMFADDHAMLKWGLLVYDSLYAWCREAHAGANGWYPEELRVRGRRPPNGSGVAAEVAGRAAAAPPAPTRAEAFRYWLKLGFVSFGGPAGQIAIMHHDLVDSKRWISERRFLHALNYCMVLPGPEAQQLATYIGWLMHRTWGGVVAGALFVLPSLVVLIALSWLYMAYGSVPAVAGILYGIKPAVVAIVLHAAWRIGSRALKRPVLWVIAALAFVAIFAFSVPFPAIVLAAGIVGYVGGRLAPDEFAMGGGHGASRRPARAGGDRRRHADAAARAVPLVAARAGRRGLRAALAVRARHAGRELRPGTQRCRGWAGSSPRRRC